MKKKTLQFTDIILGMIMIYPFVILLFFSIWYLFFKDISGSDVIDTIQKGIKNIIFFCCNIFFILIIYIPFSHSFFYLQSKIKSKKYLRLFIKILSVIIYIAITTVIISTIFYLDASRILLGDILGKIL